MPNPCPNFHTHDTRTMIWTGVSSDQETYDALRHALRSVGFSWHQDARVKKNHR